jgi:predicted nucleic acid-binding protein
LKPTVVVADASPLIAIAVMDLFPVLPQLFNVIFVPNAVVIECINDVTKPKSGIIQQALTDGILIEKCLTDPTRAKLLEQLLDQGEAEALALAKELGAVVLMDERCGRQVAAREGIHCIGSLYCLIKAKEEGFIETVAPKIKQLQLHGYYLQQKLIDMVLSRCQEVFDDREDST